MLCTKDYNLHYDVLVRESKEELNELFSLIFDIFLDENIICIHDIEYKDDTFSYDEKIDIFSKAISEFCNKFDDKFIILAMSHCVNEQLSDIVRDSDKVEFLFNKYIYKNHFRSYYVYKNNRFEFGKSCLYNALNNKI